MNRFFSTIACFLLALAVFSNSAGGAIGEPGVTRGPGERDLKSYVVNLDGSYVMTSHTAHYVGDAAEIKSSSTMSLSYNGSLQRMDIVQAYTLKSDGERFVVPPDQIKDTEEPQLTDPPMFQDLRLKVIAFPAVAVGDHLVLEYTVRQITPFFSKIFLEGFSLARNPGTQMTVIFDMPEDVPLYADNVGFVSSTPQAKPGRKLYQWDYVPTEFHRWEAGAVSTFDRGQRLQVSNIPDMASYAAAYGQRAREKINATARIQALARRITRGISDPRAKAYALDNWVRQHIRYVAMFIGAGGFVAHNSDTILDTLFGDCKDHSTLLQSMLAAVGIDSTGALIDAGNQYTLPNVAGSVFNHEITYIPSLDLYLDSTATGVAPGYLSNQELDKPTLLVRSGKIGHTPMSQEITKTSKTEIKVNVDGSADFTSTEYDNGFTAEATRDAFRKIGPADRERGVENILRVLGQHGSGTLEFANLNDVGPDFHITLRGQSTDLMNLPGPVGAVVPASLGNDIAQQLTLLSQEKQRSQPFTCFNMKLEEQAHIVLPDAIEVLAMPKALAIHDSVFDYSSEYLYEKESIDIKRRFQLHHHGVVCTPADYKLMQPALTKMLGDVKSQIIVQAR